MSEPIMTPRELNRATLARQLLLPRQRRPSPSRPSPTATPRRARPDPAPRDAAVVAAVERVAGLQSQDSRAAAVGLWTRLPGLRCDDTPQASSSPSWPRLPGRSSTNRTRQASCAATCTSSTPKPTPRAWRAPRPLRLSRRRELRRPLHPGAAPGHEPASSAAGRDDAGIGGRGGVDQADDGVEVGV